VAAALLVTSTFASTAAREASSGGLADLTRLTVPHDLLALSDEARASLAARVIGQALDALTAASR